MTDHEKPCPNCGHCPTCGRTPAFQPAYPYWYPQPWWQTPNITWTTGPHTTTGGASNVTVSSFRISGTTAA